MLPSWIWSRARPRMVSAAVWLPVLPPMLATMGISAASATTFSIVPSNTPMTREATKAVSRFRASQAQRLRALLAIGAKRSSSSCRPAWVSISFSAVSRTWSMTASTASRPTTCRWALTTGADSRS